MRDLLWIEEEECICEDDPQDASDEELDAIWQMRERQEEMAGRELEWFYGTLGGRVPDEGTNLANHRPAAQAIAAWLASIAAFHRGALAMQFTPREWPSLLTELYGRSTSLVIRLECVLHPSDGKPTEQHERESVARLLASRGAGYGLLRRARAHEMIAVRTYIKARGGVPCVVPDEQPDSGPDTMVPSAVLEAVPGSVPANDVAPLSAGGQEGQP
jgi:hypothetical protein